MKILKHMVLTPEEISATSVSGHFDWGLPGEGRSLCLQVLTKTLLDLFQQNIALFQFVQQTSIWTQLNHLAMNTETHERAYMSFYMFRPLENEMMHLKGFYPNKYISNIMKAPTFRLLKAFFMTLFHVCSIC